MKIGRTSGWDKKERKKIREANNNTKSHKGKENMTSYEDAKKIIFPKYQTISWARKSQKYYGLSWDS
jgi:hypothetical protein